MVQTAAVSWEGWHCLQEVLEEGEEVPDPAGRRSSLVLLAEDDSEIRDLLASVLRKDGHPVLEARDGAQLLELIQGSRRSGQRPWTVALVITDIRMPGCSGLDAVEELRRGDPLTPVIVITGYGDPDARSRAGRLGVTAILDKPFEVEDLREVVHHLLESGPGPPAGPARPPGGRGRSKGILEGI